MQQLGELQGLVGEFRQRRVQVVAVSTEETTMRAHRGVLAQLEGEPSFPILADLQRAKTAAYERTSAYFIDRRGRIRQIFPMEIYARPPWWAILNEIDRLRAER